MCVCQIASPRFPSRPISRFLPFFSPPRIFPSFPLGPRARAENAPAILRDQFRPFFRMTCNATRWRWHACLSHNLSLGETTRIHLLSTSSQSTQLTDNNILSFFLSLFRSFFLSLSLKTRFILRYFPLCFHASIFPSKLLAGAPRISPDSMIFPSLVNSHDQRTCPRLCQKDRPGHRSRFVPPAYDPVLLQANFIA